MKNIVLFINMVIFFVIGSLHMARSYYNINLVIGDFFVPVDWSYIVGGILYFLVVLSMLARHKNN